MMRSTTWNCKAINPLLPCISFGQVFYHRNINGTRRAVQGTAVSFPNLMHTLRSFVPGQSLTESLACVEPCRLAHILQIPETAFPFSSTLLSFKSSLKSHSSIVPQLLPISEFVLLPCDFIVI